MLGVATSSPSPPTLKENGSLLLELQGFAIGDSLTDLLQLSKLRKIPDLFPELATDSFIYANLCYQQFENFTEKVDPLPGAVPILRRVDRLHNSILMGESGEALSVR